jgi:hypothetical protein
VKASPAPKRIEWDKEAAVKLGAIRGNSIDLVNRVGLHDLTLAAAPSPIAPD